MSNHVRIALANVRFAASPDESIDLARSAVARAADDGAAIVCFPEGFVPGYRSAHRTMPPPDAEFLQRAWAAVADAAAASEIAVVLGTERLVDGKLLLSALVLGSDGAILGCQDKVQIDPSEEGTYWPADGRRIFRAGPLVFGVAICHEGWRYPETVRWAARRGAHVVFHPHFHEAEAGSYRPRTFADPANTFHEKALLCRAAENTCYVASVNYAGDGSPTTSAVVDPDGTVVCFQPYGEEGILVADLDLDRATGFLAKRYRTIDG